MKRLKVTLIAVGLLLHIAPGAFAAVTQEQALVRAKEFLASIGIRNLSAQPEQLRQGVSDDDRPVWNISWSEASVQMGIESGEIAYYNNSRLRQASRDRFKSGEIPAMLEKEEAIRLAQEFAAKTGLPFQETKIENPRIVPFTNTPSESSDIGKWRISFRRFYRGYRTLDWFSVTIDPYENCVVNLMSNWGAPDCDITVSLNQDEAIRLALEGFAARGVPAVLDPGHQPTSPFMILRPDYAWTDYPIPVTEVPFTRLVYLIPTMQPDRSPIGIVWIDAATGEWLGGDGVMGHRVKIQSVPARANASAFLVSRCLRAEKAKIHSVSENSDFSLSPRDKSRRSALGSLLSTLRPLAKAPQGPGQQCLSMVSKGRTYHLKRAGNALRLEGPDVPGSALGFQADKNFEAKLAALKAMP